jgi:hypothetical protein
MTPIWLVNLSAAPASNRIEIGRRNGKSGAWLKIEEEWTGTNSRKIVNSIGSGSSRSVTREGVSPDFTDNIAGRFSGKPNRLLSDPRN